MRTIKKTGRKCTTARNGFKNKRTLTFHKSPKEILKFLRTIRDPNGKLGFEFLWKLAKK